MDIFSLENNDPNKDVRNYILKQLYIDGYNKDMLKH